MGKDSLDTFPEFVINETIYPFRKLLSSYTEKWLIIRKHPNIASRPCIRVGGSINNGRCDSRYRCQWNASKLQMKLVEK